MLRAWFYLRLLDAFRNIPLAVSYYDTSKNSAGQVEPRKVLVVGDSYTKDILPAHEIGCRTCWLKGEGWDKQEPEAPVADLIIHELKSLLAYT